MQGGQRGEDRGSVAFFREGDSTKCQSHTRSNKQTKDNKSGDLVSLISPVMTSVCCFHGNLNAALFLPFQNYTDIFKSEDRNEYLLTDAYFSGLITALHPFNQGKITSAAQFHSGTKYEVSPTLKTATLNF